jgi:hypothetical protein
MFSTPPVDLQDWHAQLGSALQRACPTAQVDAYRALYEQKQALTAAMMRTAVALHAGLPLGVREFVGDDLAMAMNCSPLAGKAFVTFAVQACALPGLVEAIETGELSDSHARVVLRELDRVVVDDTERAAIVTEALARAAEKGRARGYVLSPWELGRLLRALILLRDVRAAAKRRARATADRGVSGAADRDGQGYLCVSGPLEQVAAITARARALGRVPGNTRTFDQLCFDAAYELLTVGAEGGQLATGQAIAGIGLQVVVPFDVLAGSDDQLAEIPGWGPILPSTARELAGHADRLRRVCVDTDGRLLAVDDAVPGPARKRTGSAEHPDRVARVHAPPPADVVLAALHQMASQPLVPRDLSTPAYRIPARLSRYVKIRDRSCVFPGCHRTATDDDHRQPWPAGRTDPQNLQCLCRHHHRAKQAAYQVQKLPDGSYLWTTRTGHAYKRPPPDY